ncbi:tetratricopeptide repeat-containing response regulator [Halopseudomonas salina]|uniref:Response regulator n=1 Tax=Halopseudomonas salina TaxID=1323744 RepID=A0ABQ1P8Z4_9GAMM|nr:tetratricopeptide repeat-containing response regulator [Halopseudomonas salina]GGC93180.1 response regulator [Halopseudomonas salina]
MIDYSKKRFLVVDDFSEFRTSVTGMLRLMAVKQVDAAARGEDAIAMCRNTRYDVILHDYNLGAGKNGQQVLEELHHAGLISPHCIFVMCTAESSQAMVMSALECEPDAYLTKPFNRASLQQRLDKLVERKLALKPILDAQVKNDQQAVLAACDQVMAANKRFAPQCLRHKAGALKALGKHAELEALLNELIADRPLPWALIMLGNHWLAIGELDKAESLFTSSISQFPMLPALFDGLAAVHAARGASAKAQEYLEQGLRISPNSLQRQHELGRLARANGDYDKAIRAFRQAVDLGRNSQFRNPDDHLGLASSLNEQAGDEAPSPKALLEIRQTLGDLGKAWKDDPKVTIRGNLVHASAVAKTGDQAAADKLVAEASVRMADLPNFFTAQIALEVAAQMQHLGHADKAESVLATCAEMYGDDARIMEAIASQTSNPEILNAGLQAQTLNREGIKAYQQQQFPQALDLFRQARDLQPRNISFALNTAQSVLRLLLAEPSADLKDECLQCLAQVSNIPATDSRYPRYEKLCKTVAGL